jgi:bacterioferritin-associated ferredoxin
MLVCVCRGVSDREVREALAGGASTLRDLGRACGAGVECGSCHNLLRSLIRAHTQQKAQAGASDPPAPALGGT